MYDLSLVLDFGTSLNMSVFNFTCAQVGHKFKNGKGGFQLVDELATGVVAELFPSWK